MNLRTIALCAFLPFAACEAPDGDDKVVPPTEPPPAPWSLAESIPDGLAPADALFRWDVVHEIRFDLTPEARQRLQNNPRAYAPTTMTIDGVVVPSAMRLKGSSTFQPLSGKPSIKVKLDAFQDGYSLFGVEGFNLHNQVADASFVGEHLGYRVMRDLGVPAPRTGHAAVWVGDQYKGLYALVERKDSDWIRTWYADSTGSLYEGIGCELNGQSSWSGSGVDCWEVDTVGANDSKADLQELLFALNTSGATFWGNVDTYLDPDITPRGLAAEWILGHWDSYSGNLNNYHLYHEPSTSTWSLSPWSMDLSFGRPVGGNCNTTPTDRGTFTTGMLAQRCRGNTDCNDQVLAAASETLDLIDAMDVDATLIELTDVMSPWIDLEPNATTPQRWRRQVTCARNYLVGRRGAVGL